MVPNCIVVGFTLAEPCVIISLVGISVSWMFTAVQSARGAAGRNPCFKQLQHIDVALVNPPCTLNRMPVSSLLSNFIRRLGSRVSDIDPGKNCVYQNEALSNSYVFRNQIVALLIEACVVVPNHWATNAAPAFAIPESELAAAANNKNSRFRMVDYSRLKKIVPPLALSVRVKRRKNEFESN